MNNKVKFLRGTSGEYAVVEKDSDTIYFTTDDGKLYIGDKEVSGDGSVTIDDTLSDTSTNPVQNKVVKQAIDNKADKIVATTETDGLMSAEDKTKLDNADNTYALKSKYGDSTINVGRKAETDVGEYSTAEGQTTTASGAYSHAEGYKTIASGIGSHAEGSNYFLSGVSSSRKVTISNGEESTIYTIDGSYAYGINSHAEGARSFAYGSSSHAEGCDTTASGSYSHAEGRDTTASGAYSHAEGDFITASGTYSHAEGYRTIASGSSSHAEGCYTTAGGRYSHAGGYYTKALKVAEFAHGQYNQSNNNTLFSIGDGTADDARHNAFEITTTGGKLHDKDIATTDLIPTSLPANGGNADTVDGLHAEKFMRYEVDKTLTTSINDMITPGTYGVCIDTPDFPTGYGSWGLLEVQAYGSICYQIIRFESNIIISRVKIVNQTEWSNWKRSSDGGNADTLNGMNAETIRSMSKNVDSGTSASSLLADGTYCGVWSDAPSGLIDTQGILIVSNYNTNGASSPWSHRTFYSPHYNMIWHGITVNNIWYGWKEISTTPIKSTTFSGTTDAYSNIALWAKSENKIPILFECIDKNATVFYGKGSNFYAYVTNHLHQNVVETAVSGTVWYVEV